MNKVSAKPQSIGVFIKILNANTSDYIHILTGFDLQEVIILNVTSDIIISYASQEVAPLNIAVVNEFKTFEPSTLVQGLVMRMNIDLMNVIRVKGFGIEKYIKQLPKSAILRIDVKVDGNGLDISMPPDQVVDLAVMLHAVLPGT